MDNLGGRLKALRQDLLAEEAQDRALREAIRSALIDILGGEAKAGLISGYHLRSGRLHLKAKNKTAASELFLNREKILVRLTKQLNIKELIVS